ncbi:hypothetical protein Tco_0831235 [Tanacetum coccineum]
MEAKEDEVNVAYPDVLCLEILKERHVKLGRSLTHVNLFFQLPTPLEDKPIEFSPYPDISCAESGSGGGVVDLTGDEDPTDKDGDIGVSVSLGVEIFLEGKKFQESNIGDSDNTRDGGKTVGRAIITWGGGIASLISESEGTIVE